MPKVPLKYPIGTLGVPWTASHKSAWLASRTVHRSYLEDVVTQLQPPPSLLNNAFDIIEYGSILSTSSSQSQQATNNSKTLPLLAAIPRTWDNSKPCALITGGVHGYETSGVRGAIRFLRDHACTYSDACNLVVAPCVSPWGYECIERWNANAIDPNRSFGRMDGNGSDATEEGDALMAFLDGLGDGSAQWLCHVDLHETTDSDVSEFRPSKAARDGLTTVDDSIPDGFYLVGDSEEMPQSSDFLASIIDSVRDVTRIAEADDEGLLCGEPLAQDGVFVIPAASYGICASVTGARYATTTEVYPDSSNTNQEECVQAQVTAVCAALDYVIQKEGLRC